MEVKKECEKFANKATIDEIRECFDSDVERFSNLETGQVSTVDAMLSLEIAASAAQKISPNAKNLLDVGCGAGNYTLKMLAKIQALNCVLLDLSKPMLERAVERISKKTSGQIDVIQNDIRAAILPENHFDIILASAVLHHLRDDKDWENAFAKFYRSLKNGGCLIISDLITQNNKSLKEYFEESYYDYLQNIGGKDYARKILKFIEKEDTPRSMDYQIELMKKTGFESVEILHKNMCFGVFGAIK
jgi:tRNA (cmo5U34)-methyltransferase